MTGNITIRVDAEGVDETVRAGRDRRSAVLSYPCARVIP